MNFMTFHSIGNFIIPTDELIFFRGDETTNQHSIISTMCSHFIMELTDLDPLTICEYNGLKVFMAHLYSTLVTDQVPSTP